MYSGLITSLLLCAFLTFSCWACTCPYSSENSAYEKVLESSPEDDAKLSTALPGTESSEETASDSKPASDNGQFVKEPEPETTTAASVDEDKVDDVVKEDRVVGGTDAQTNEFPWQVRVHSSSMYCGGTVIDEFWVLTAAHCIVDNEPSQVDVVFGDTNPYVLEAGEFWLTPSELHPHPAYDYNKFDFDFGLIKFNTPLNLSSGSVGKAYLPSGTCNDSTCESGSLATATGWGLVENSEYPSTLQKLTMQIISLNECRKRWGYILTENMICTLPEVIDGDLSGICSGDSGGPLGQFIVDQFTLCGITSWGLMTGCGDNYYPDVFSKVCRVVDWIEWMIACVEEPVNNICPGMCSTPCPWNGVCVGENSCFCVSGKGGEMCN